ncbi:MAG: amino acid adenylation domain-containing protein, partial [Micromonosporaceae bacterium]|nr:amino acid adenylation domain-containing protein [Micromonosporaceae bacterium]
LAYMVADAGLPILLTRNSLLAMVPTGQARVLDLETLWPRLGQQPATPPASGVGADHLAYMIYTSGSTGRPKGVQITHRGIQAIPRWQHPNYGLDRPQRVLQGTSLSFDISVWEISAALLCGSTLVLPDPDLRMMGSDLQDLLVRQGVDTIILTPSALATLSEADLPAVRCITVGGEACPLDLVRTWAPGRAFFNGYGPTEATVGVCLARYEADLQRVHIGRAIPGAQLYVLDSRLQLLPIGVAGELCIGGSGLARGYCGRPDLTAATFLADPFSQQPGSRLYRTGDRVRLLPDGTIEFLGRIDEQIKIRGFRVELGEIESALSQHPDVLAAAVRLHEDRSAKRLIAYVVAGEPVAPEDLRRFLGDRLPEYMVPGVFVPLDQLPINANGKLDRRALAALPWEQHAVVAQRQHIAPRTPVEEQLAAIWQDVLKTGGPVGVHDNFLALGGDSILSLQIIFRAKQLGWHFTAKQLFEHQTIAELGAVAVRQPVAAVEAEQGVVTGPVELTPIQRWFFGQRFARSQHWNQSAVLDVPAGLAPAQWERLLLRLLEQHDALRARFIPDGDTWRAALAAPGDRAPLEVCDLSAVPPQRRDEERAAAARRAQASLDLSTAPLVRAVLFTGSGGQVPDRLLLVAHHLVIDVVSWHILLADLETLIERLRGGQDLTLPAKSSSWRRWAARLRQEATSATTVAELDYWREQTAATACSLPTDLPGQDNLTGQSRVCEVALDRAETEALLHDLPAAFETRVNEVLLTAVAAALGGWTQDTHVRIDVEGHGREDLFEEIDCSRTVGWFTTVSPLRLPVAAPHALGEGLKQIKELLRRRPRQGIGYGLLRYGPAQAGFAQAGPAQAGSPLAEGAAAQVSFNYLGQTDQSVTGGFAAASELAAPDLDPGNHRPYLVDLVSAVESGRLRMVWTYNETVHERATIEGVAQQTLEAFRALVDHARRADLCTYTPSDVELSGLTQRQLDELVGQLRDLPAWRDGGQRPLEDCYPQTPVQRGLLFQSQYDRGQGLYHVQMILRIDEDLRLDAFRESWSRVMERHPILRTSFWEAGGGQALQLVWRRLPVPLEVVDWREHPAEHRQRLLQDHLSADRRQGFDAGAIPQWRMLLARTADECYQLVWSAHHAIVDGWSTSLLLSEMASGYGEIVSGNPEARLPVRPYRDYVAWLADQDMSQAERYWREVLHGVEQATGLSVERRPAPGAQDDAEPATQAWRSLFLTEAETAALQRLAQEHRVTLNTLMQGCWALLTSRYSRSEDVVFGVVVSGRPPEVDGVDRMIGLFINTLPLRVHVSGQERWLDWLRRLQEQNTGMRQYEYSPLNLVRQWGEIPADASLFDSLFVFENYPPDEHRATGLRFQDLGSEERTHYPLNLVITLEARLGLRILFDTRRFDEQTIATMLGHLRQICRELARSPHQLLAQADLLTGAERSTLLGEWSATERTDPEPTYLHELVAQQVARTPDSVAVVDADQQLTYAELDRRANQLARWLQARGVGPDVLVGLCVERSIEVMIGLLGILKAGGGYVPLDPHHPQDRLAYLIDDARPRLLVTQSHLLATLPTGDLETLCLDGDWPLVALEPRTAPATTLTPDNLAYIIYTSGSTGKPKGVMVAHRCLGHIVPWQRGHPEFSRRQNVLQVASYSFDFSVWEIIMPLLTGGTLHIPRSDLHMIGMDLYQTLRDRAIENLNFTPAALATLPAEPLPHLRTLVVGGEAYSADLVRTWAPGRSFFNVYGPTETTVFATGTPIDEHLDVLHMGRPITNVRLYVLDEHLRPAPAGVPGELYIGGAGLTRGYLGRPDLTAETFIADPFGQEPGGRLYRSGDLVRYLPDGTIEFVGRVDHQVKIRGFRIELGEIEAALQQHPLVAGAAVLVQPEGASQRLVAYVVPVAAGTDPTEELRAHLEQQLPFYMIPTAFVCLDELPLTSNGKLNRRALPLPEATSPRALSERAVPRTRTEAVLATIWERILDRQPIGISDNFFALGGHSLLAVGVVARIRQAFGVQLPVRVLFEHPTIARVAEEIDRLREIQDPQETAPLVPVPRDQPLPATFDQQRLWFLDRLNPNSAFYTVGWLLHWPGAIETPTLRLALGALIERHETLRTTFSEDRGRVRQVIAPDAEVVLGEADLSAEAAGQRQASARKLVHEFWAEPFDLRHGPLVRTLLIRLSAEEAVVALSAHHTVIDGYSLRIFNQELRQLYRAATTGTPPGLPDLAVQYADYAVWQQQWLQEERLRSQLDYWKEQLADAPELITLPLDHPRPAVQSFRGATLGAALSRELTDLLRQVSTEHQTTHFITVLSAFAVLLSRYSGQDQVVLGVPIANRSRIETEPLIGFLVNTVALCVDLGEDPDFARVLQQVRWKLLDAQSHQEVPFERIVEELKPERSLSYSPVFQVMFTGLDKLFDETPDQDPEPAWLGEITDEGVGIAKFDLGLRIQEKDGELGYSFEYSTDLFEESTIARMGEHLRILLEQALACQHRPVSTLTMLTAGERTQILDSWNATADERLARPACLHDLFAEQAARTPDRIAVSFADQQLTYAGLDRRANQLA